MSKRSVSFLVGVIVVAVLCITGIVLASTGVVGKIFKNSQGKLDTLPPPPPPRTLTIAAVGDIMMGTDFPSPRLPQQDGALLFKDAAPILRAADIAFGNLEGPITTSQGCAKALGSGKTFAFRCPPSLAWNLGDAGFDVMGLANNHSMDFGGQGMWETKKILDSLGIKYSGKDESFASFTVNGIKVGLIAFAVGGPPRSILNLDLCREEVSRLSSQFDVLIVSFHGGTEGTNAIHTKNEQENLYGEPRGNVIEFAHAMIDAGADVVIGHGPHVPRGLEEYKDRIICYSLGNFCTYACMQLVAELGYAPLLVVQVDSVGQFVRGEIHSFKQIPPGGPTADANESAFKLMRDLSLADFPSSSPSFSQSLSFYPRNPSDSSLTPERLKVLRDSLDRVGIVEPDTTKPDRPNVPVTGVSTLVDSNKADIPSSTPSSPTGSIESKDTTESPTGSGESKPAEPN